MELNATDGDAESEGEAKLREKDVAQVLLSGPAAFQLFPAAQIMAFEDTSVAPLYERRRYGESKIAGHRPALQCQQRQWGLKSDAVYREIVTSGPRKLADLMQALRGRRFAGIMLAVNWGHGG